MRHTQVPGPEADGTRPLTGGNSVPAGSGPGLAATAIEVLFREHHGELVRLAVLMVGDQQTAEDVVQDVFARLHVHWSRVAAHDASPLSYVRAAVLNGCRSTLRHRGVARRVAEAQDVLARQQVFDSAEQEAITSEDRRRLLTALARLPRRRREVLVLRYYLGLSETEIASVLGVSPGTVKSTAARGLAALARVMDEEP